MFFLGLPVSRESGSTATHGGTTSHRVVGSSALGLPRHASLSRTVRNQLPSFLSFFSFSLGFSSSRPKSKRVDEQCTRKTHAPHRVGKRGRQTSTDTTQPRGQPDSQTARQTDRCETRVYEERTPEGAGGQEEEERQKKSGERPVGREIFFLSKSLPRFSNPKKEHGESTEWPMRFFLCASLACCFESSLVHRLRVERFVNRCMPA